MKCGHPDLRISVSMFLCMLSVLSAQTTVCGYLCLVCVFLPLFILVVLVQGVSSAVLFCCLQRGGCGSMPHSACSFWFWQMYFYLARNWELAMYSVGLVSLISLACSWHTRMPKAITVKYQLSFLGGSRNPALMDATLQ